MMASSFSKSRASGLIGSTRTLFGTFSALTLSTWSLIAAQYRGIFMNKYIFPGADASCSLGWVIGQVEAAGFEVKNIDVLGVHYSATLWRWYKNWISNKDKVIETYGERWYRIWVYFLASATIISRCVLVHDVYPLRQITC